MADTISPQDFAALVRDRNLNLTPQQMEEFRETYAHILAVRQRLRSPRGLDAEPAAVFRAKGV